MFGLVVKPVKTATFSDYLVPFVSLASDSGFLLMQTLGSRPSGQSCWVGAVLVRDGVPGSGRWP